MSGEELLDNYSKSLASGTKSIAKFGAALKSVFANVAIMAVADFAFSALYKAWDNYAHADEKALELAEKANNNIKNVNDSYESQKKVIDECADSYDKLSDGVNATNNQNIKLSTDDYQQYLDINNKLAESFPQLITGFDEQGNAILSIGINSSTSREELEKLLAAERDTANYKIAQNINDSFAGVAVNIKNATNELEDFHNSVSQANEGVKNVIDINDIFANFKQGDPGIILDGSLEGTAEYANAIKDSLMEMKLYDDKTYMNISTAYGVNGPYTQYFFSLAALDNDQLTELKEKVSSQFGELNRYYKDETEKSAAGLKDAEQKQALVWKDFIPSLLSATHFSASYKDLIRETPQLQSAIDNMINNLNINQSEVINDNYAGDVEQYIREEIIAPIYYAKPEVQKAYQDLFSLNPDKFTNFTDYEKQVNSLVQKIVGNNSETQTDFKIKFGLNDLSYIKEQIGQLFSPKAIRKADLISSVNTLSGSFESLDKIIASIKDNDPFDYSLLNDKAFRDNFDIPELENEFSDFIEVVSNSPKDMEACQDSLNQLVTAFINHQDLTNGLTEDTEALTAAMLNNIGVTNSEAVAHDLLLQAKANAAIASLDLSTATSDEINALAEEARVTENARQAFYAYIAQKLLDQVISGKGDIAQLTNVINILGLATTAWQRYHRVRMAMETGTKVGDAYTYEGDDGFTHIVHSSEITNAQKDLQKELTDLQDKPIAKYNSPKTNKSPGESGKLKKETKSTIDWIDRYLALLDKKRSDLDSLANSSFTSYFGLTDEEFARAAELLNKSDAPATTDLQELAEMASNAKVSISDLYTLIQTGENTDSKRGLLDAIIQNDKDRLSVLEQAIPKYKQQYAELKKGLDDETIFKIENGSIQIEDYSEDEKSQIEKVQSAYDKLTDKQHDYSDTKLKLFEDTKQPYENEIAYMDNQAAILKHQNDLIESRTDYLNASGELVNTSGYEMMIANMDKETALIEKQIQEKKHELQALIDAGMSEDDPEYYDGLKYLHSMEDALGNIAEEQAKIKKQILETPINHMDTILSMYDSITEAIQNWSSELEASGQKLDKTYYQTLINHGTEIIDQYDEQAGLIEEVMNEYETGSDNWNELYSRLQSVNSAMSSMVKNLYEWNEALLKLPLESLGTFSDELQRVSDALTDIQSDYDTVISTVTDSIQKEIDRLGEEKEVTEETYQKKIDLLQEQIDLMDKANEKRQMELAVEQALYDLEKAKGQKTNRVIRDGKISYEADAEQIRSAEETLTDAREDMEKYGLQKQLEGLQDELDSVNDIYDGQIEKLEEMAEKWGDIKTNVEEAHDSALTEQYLGAGWMEQILSGNDSGIFSNFKSMYETLDKQLTDYEEQISSTENIYSLLEDYITSYQEGKVTYEQAMAAINHLLSQMNEKLTANGNLQNILDYVGVSFGNSTGKTPEAILDTLKDSFKDTGDKLLASLAQYNETAGMITEYTSSWEQLTDNVASMKDILEEVRDNLDDTLDEISQLRDDYEEEDEEDDDVHYTTDGDTSPRHDKDDWGSDTEGPGAGLSYAPKYFADGIHNGAIGKNSPSEHVSLLKLLATQKLHPDEVPIIAHRGEVVLNPEQQAMILKNVSPLYNPFSGISIPDYPFLAAKRELPQVIVNLGGVTMHEVSSCDAFAKELGDTFGIKMRQQVSKYLP